MNPRRCTTLSLCPPGSMAEDIRITAGLFILACASSAIAGAKFYSKVVSRGRWVCLICAGLVGLAWLVDVAIAGYMTLVYSVVVANWALLRLGARSGWASHIVMLTTLLAALAALWFVNPPWCVLCGGLGLYGGIGYMMSRQNFYLVLCGRFLLVLAFVALIIVYIQVDSGFAAMVGAVNVTTIFALLLSWICEQRRQRRTVAMPFLTRWRWRSSENEDLLFDYPTPQAPVQQTRRDLHGTSELPISNPAHTMQVGGASSSRGPRSSSLRPDASSGSKALQADGVSFHLEDVSFDLPDGCRLLTDVNLSIAAGRRVAVMGPSGSGKSTLLAVLSGRASYGRVSGKLEVSGHQTDGLQFLRHTTGFVPQDDVLHGELTVEDNIMFQAALRLPADRTYAQLEEACASVAKDLNLTLLMKARVGTPEKRGISGGQRKRTSIAMELVAQPLLLFADEPTSGLDSTTSHEVIRCLNGASARLGATVAAVIHQPRFETLQLFDDLILLSAGYVVYAGPVQDAVNHFQRQLRVEFPPNNNPADVFMDAIQPPLATPENCASVWKANAPLQDSPHTKPAPASLFFRVRVPFFKAVLIYMDRSMLQTLRAYRSLLINQFLCMVTIYAMCNIMPYIRLDHFLMQSALAALALMLLQGVAAQRVFGQDLLITWREARVGMPMVAYFVAKDMASLFEITLSAAVFAATYGACSGAQLGLLPLFAGSWSFIYSVFGLNYIFSIVLSPGAAQMSAVVASFMSFCVAGVYQPQLPAMAIMLKGRGWMVPALSPIRWFWAFLLTHEVPHLEQISLEGARGSLRDKGYDTQYLEECTSSWLLRVGTAGSGASASTLKQAWIENRGWVCSTSELLLLGIMLRFLAGLCLVLYVNAQTSGWARFFGQSEVGAWKLAGNLFALLLGSFLALFLFAEVWVFGISRLEFHLSVWPRAWE